MLQHELKELHGKNELKGIPGKWREELTVKGATEEWKNKNKEALDDIEQFLGDVEEWCSEGLKEIEANK